MKKKYGCILATAIYGTIRLLRALFNFIVKGLTGVFLKTGLIVPMLYFLFGVILQQFFGFDPSEDSLNTDLYKIGFVISILLMGVILVRNVVLKPFKGKKALMKNRTYKPNKNETLPPPEPTPDTSIPQKKEYYQLPVPQSIPDINPSTYYSVAPTQGEEKPLVYRSKMLDGIVVFEYHDRFKLFREVDGKLLLVRVEYKKN